MRLSRTTNAQEQRVWMLWKATNYLPSLATKKSRVYLMTWVERKTRCIVAHGVVWHRTEDDLRELVWQVMPSARQYFNDAVF